MNQEDAMRKGTAALHDDLTHYMVAVERLRAENKALEQEVELLRAALEVAAMAFQQLESPTHFVYVPDDEADARRHYAGKAKVTARRALAGPGKEE
jgi:hypothetical protein